MKSIIEVAELTKVKANSLQPYRAYLSVNGLDIEVIFDFIKGEVWDINWATVYPEDAGKLTANNVISALEKFAASNDLTVCLNWRE